MKKLPFIIWKIDFSLFPLPPSLSLETFLYFSKRSCWILVQSPIYSDFVRKNGFPKKFLQSWPHFYMFHYYIAMVDPRNMSRWRIIPNVKFLHSFVYLHSLPLSSGLSLLWSSLTFSLICITVYRNKYKHDLEESIDRTLSDLL